MIDLSVYKSDVDRIFGRHFYGWVTRHGYDPEDVLSEVYLGIMVRNRGSCPWTEGKGQARGTYIYQVIRCVVSNYHRKMTCPTKRGNEVLGVLGWGPDGQRAWVDAGSVDVADGAMSPEDVAINLDAIRRYAGNGWEARRRLDRVGVYSVNSTCTA